MRTHQSSAAARLLTALSASTTTSATLTGLSPDTAYTVAVYAKDAAGNRSPRSATTTLTTTNPPTGTCAVAYRVVNEWPGGFQADLTVRNTGTAPVNGWTLTFAFPAGQTVTNMWGGVPTQTGDTVRVAPASYTTTIPASGSVTLGFTGTKGTTNPAPTAFTLNGASCTTS